MIKGRANRNLETNSFEISIYDNDREICYTFEFKAHKCEANQKIQVTKIFEDENNLNLLKGMAEALREMGLPQDLHQFGLIKREDDLEYQAQARHLEDMRMMNFKLIEVLKELS